MLPLTVWMNMPSFYQSDLFRALLTTGEVDLEVIFARGLPEERVRLGWQTDLEGFSYHFLDRGRPAADALRIAWAQRRRFHIVNGLWAEPAFTAALSLLAMCGADYAVYSEAPNPTFRRSPAKRVLQKVLGGALVRRARGLLPVSHMAADFFKSLGAEERVEYPFGYFRECSRGCEKGEGAGQKAGINVVFVGQVIPRKGPDILLDAILPLFERYGNLHLTLIGEGEMLGPLTRRVEEAGCSSRVTFTGAVPSNLIPAYLSGADALVLPSRWDGWGLVVNEALSMGAPVIVSQTCGAAEVIQHGRNGYVFRNEDVDDLRSCLTQFMGRRDDWKTLKAAAASLGKSLSPASAASYLVECLRHMSREGAERPVPPWVRGEAAR